MGTDPLKGACHLVLRYTIYKKMEEHEILRKIMVEEQLVSRGILDVKVLKAMETVEREEFVPDEQRMSAYWDGPLPIGKGQTISQPYMVAKMTEELKLEGDEKVLEIGTGSGYQAAVLSVLSKEVVSIERDEDLAYKAQNRLRNMGYNNIEVVVGDGTKGYPDYSPYDAIIVTAGAPYVPEALKEQLNEGGRLVIPVGDHFSQILTTIYKRGKKLEEKISIACVFVPLKGEFGWQE